MADATATPATIAATVTIDPVGLQGDLAVQVGTIQATTTLPSPTLSAGQTASPAVISTVGTLPAATAKAGATASPDVSLLSVTLPAPTPKAGTTRAVSTVTGAFTLPVVTYTVTQYINSTPLTINIDVTATLTAQLLGYQKYAADGRPPEYNVVVLTPGGTQLCSLENAQVADVSWILNGAGVMSFTLPIQDPKITHMVRASDGLPAIPDREVQLWRGPDLLWAGVVIRASGDDKTVTFQCAELGWYFTKRVVGTAETNYVPNGGFEQGIEHGWRIQYHAHEWASRRNEADWTAETRTNLSISGEKSLYLYSNANMVYGIMVASDGFFWTADPGPTPEGEFWFLTAWSYIPDSEWISQRTVGDSKGTPLNIGVMLTRTAAPIADGGTGETVTVDDVPGLPSITYPKGIESVVIPITESTPRDQWVRHQIPLTQPVTGFTEIIEVQCWAPVGGIYWDEISLVRQEALFYNNVDQALILQGLVSHAQDTGIGKSDLRITPSCPLTGKTRTRTYWYFNHERISDTIDEWPSLWDGMDWSIDVTPATRTFRSHYPRRGTLKTKYALMLGKNVHTLRMKVDGEETSNSVIVMADLGEGAAREEGVASHPTTLTDGLTLERVHVATPGSSINTLQAQAERSVRRYSDPVVLPDLVLFQDASKEILGMIQPGDVVPVVVNLGWYNLNDNFRITEIRLDPKTEVLTISINPEVNWELPSG